jgi:hypothetical protein
MTTDKKEEKPRYETPMILRLDQIDKADGAGNTCITGSAVLNCTAGNNATQTCVTGGAGQLLPG